MKKFSQEQILEFTKLIKDNSDIIFSLINLNLDKDVGFFKKGGKSKIHIKKENQGKFTDYCNGKVTNECILKGKNSPDPKIRKRATFAANARKWN